MFKMYCKNLDFVNAQIWFALNEIDAKVKENQIIFSNPISKSEAQRIVSSFQITRIENFEETIEAVPVAPKQETSIAVEKEDTVTSNEFRFDVNYPANFNNVRAGEIYLCDFGEPKLRGEIGKVRPALVVQTDILNPTSYSTIVIPISSSQKKIYPCQMLLSNDPDDYFEKTFITKEHSILKCEQITRIDKNRLLKYLGRVTPNYLKKICTPIEKSLCFSSFKETPKEVIVEKEVEKIIKVPVKSDEESMKKSQIEMLKQNKINLSALLEISSMDISKEEKTLKFLNLFGFMPTKVNYLQKAILISAENPSFGLSDITEKISKESGIICTPAEIEKTIVSRIKNGLNAKSMTFIHLVASLV